MLKKKLEKIKSSRLRLIDCCTPETLKYRKQKPRFNQRDDEIYRENRILLSKLLTLSEEKLRLKKFRSHENITKSHQRFRIKKNFIKLEEENKQLANRIINSSPTYPVSQLLIDYNTHISRCQKISKYDYPLKTIGKMRSSIKNLKTSTNDSKAIAPCLQEYINPYLNQPIESLTRKQWKIASLSALPSNNNLMAVPIAL